MNIYGPGIGYIDSKQVVANKLFVWSLEFHRKMANHLEIRKCIIMEVSGKNLEFPETFFSCQIENSKGDLDSSRRIEKLVENSRIYAFVLYSTNDIIVISELLWSFLKEYIYSASMKSYQYRNFNISENI